jgi:intein-encoded DNA endonuclease-like protein
VLKCKPFKVWWYEKRAAWCTVINSIMLYKFLKKPLEDFKQYVEHCRSCASAFLRAFFDCDGSSSKGEVKTSNTDLSLLDYVASLLERFFEIKARGPRPTGLPPGSKTVIKGHLYNVNKQSYYLRLARKDNLKFAQVVGYTIRRKHAGIAI